MSRLQSLQVVSLLLSGCGGGSDSPPLAVRTPTVVNRDAVLEWQAPMTNADGSMLTDLAGYHIHHWTGAPKPNGSDEVIEIANPTVLSYNFESLPSGAWYFALTAYNTRGYDSALSAVVTKSIP
jgi:hypothetical protein